MNPFDYEAPNDMTDEMILDIYVEDFNYSRFIQSPKNTFLIGERGCGKTITLLYNSFRVQHLKQRDEQASEPITRVGVYAPCNNPMMQKEEYKLLPSFKAHLLSEHYVVLTIVYGLAESLDVTPDLFSAEEKAALAEEIKYVLGWDLSPGNLFNSLKLYVDRELVQTQNTINQHDPEAFYENTATFTSTVIPLIRALKRQPVLAKAHFLFLIDDAHDLNRYQKRLVNSWVAFRDHTDYSFKIAITKADKYRFLTTRGGTILEGHDYSAIDLERPYQHKHSAFAKHAKLIVEKRLRRANILDTTAEAFFPASTLFEADLQRAKEAATARANEIFSSDDPKYVKQRNGYIYRHARVEYFRARSSKANRPSAAYTGFDLLTHISTGVVRNLLDPCYWMYEEALSASRTENAEETVSAITPVIQSRVLLERSQKQWERLDKGLDKDVIGCSTEQGRQINNLFKRLAELFHFRLLFNDSEPRAISFVLTQYDEYYQVKLEPLFAISRTAQLLYLRTGSSKDGVNRKRYYVPNRILWPAVGLDPHGQHAAVSLKAPDVWAAAANNKMFPFVERSKDMTEGLFDD